MVKRAAPKKRQAAASVNTTTSTTTTEPSDRSPQHSSSSKRSKSSSSSVMFGKSKKKGVSNGVLTMFQSIAEDPNDTNSVVNMEGIGDLGEKLGIDATEDIRILVLLWKMKCIAKPGCITLKEWTEGCESFNVDSWECLKDQLPSLETGFLECSAFKDFYKFCFKFNLSGSHRTLQKEVVVELLKLVLKDRIPTERIESVCSFLNSSENYSQITLDQWCSILEFITEMGLDDENNANNFTASYDESTSAWPVMIDEYVEYIEKQRRS